jgi:hypothetical protein
MKLINVRLFGAGQGSTKEALTLEAFEKYKSMLTKCFNQSARFYGFNSILL